MLSLLLPWRDWQDIKGQHKTFQAAFHEFFKTALQHDLDIILEIQYYYNCKNVVLAQNLHVSKPAFISFSLCSLAKVYFIIFLYFITFPNIVIVIPIIPSTSAPTETTQKASQLP